MVSFAIKANKDEVDRYRDMDLINLFQPQVKSHKSCTTASIVLKMSSKSFSSSEIVVNRK